MYICLQSPSVLCISLQQMTRRRRMLHVHVGTKSRSWWDGAGSVQYPARQRAAGTGSGIFCLHKVLCPSGASNATGLGEAFEVMRQFLLSHTQWLVQILSRLIIFSCFISLIGRWKYSHCVHRKPEALWLWLVSINA